jgi:hypothetical protein
MTRRAWTTMAVAAAAIPVLAFTFGGWAVVTVDDLPEYAMTGQPVNLSYTVRQHGMSMMSGLSGSVMASSEGSRDTVRVLSRAFGSTYRASVILPHGGEWTFRISTGFGTNSSTLLPIRAVAQGPGVTPPAPIAEFDRGHQLFVAKGCSMCHALNEAGPMQYSQIGPRLTGRQYPPAYLAEFLADPEKSPLSKATVSQWRMPNLGLKPAEISALVAFINSEGRRVASGEPGMQ